MPKTRSPKKSRPTSKKSTGSSKSNRSAKGVVASKKPLTPKNAFDSSGKVKKASKRAASPCATGLRNFAVEVNKCKQAAKLQRMTSKVKTVVAATAKEPKKEEAKEGKAAKTEPKSKEGSNGKETTKKKDTDLKKQPPEKVAKELEERKPSQVKTNNSKVSEKILKEEVAKEGKGKAAEELVAKDNNNDNKNKELQERKQSKVKTDPKETKTKDAAKEGK